MYIGDTVQAKRKLAETIEFLESRVADSSLIARQQWETLREISSRIVWPKDVRLTHGPIHLSKNGR